ncbi:MAG: thiol peroxidase [Chloroflexaceae bacterium]|nr:thiol peroxidase [Chloroflexaceae bacterium]NJL33217.1 thiol peroxidase [Chloroflexaceae bacterium]NJO05510.1 thiol peroxidase [Chloroflexaceae bacterium]
MTIERAEAFDFWGKRTLVGPQLKPGDTAPDFTLINDKFQFIQRHDLSGKPMLISVVPSLDTAVCSMQTARFDQEAANFGDSITVVTVSADLPFAQKRWCGDHNITNSVVLSDHREMSFGAAYGTLVKDLRIESRAVFVVDANGVVQYAEYVPLAGSHPDYVAVLEALQDVVK